MNIELILLNFSLDRYDLCYAERDKISRRLINKSSHTIYDQVAYNQYRFVCLLIILLAIDITSFLQQFMMSVSRAPRMSVFIIRFI